MGFITCMHISQAPYRIPLMIKLNVQPQTAVLVLNVYYEIIINMALCILLLFLTSVALTWNAARGGTYVASAKW